MGQSDISPGYHPDGLREAQVAFRRCCDCLRDLGVPLGIREQLTRPLGRWLEDEIEHAEYPRRGQSD